MRRFIPVLVLAAIALSAPAARAADTKAKAGKPEWHMNATIIEACSCPMFCQCYFAPKPAAHAAAGEHAGHGGADAEHYCRANNVFRVNQGTYKGVKLDGAKFWLAMDLGDDFSDGTMKWSILTFDPSVTKEQREGIATILGRLYPVKWEEPIQVAADLPIEWKHEGDRAVAKLDGGKAGEVQLNAASVLRNGGGPAVIKNLRYWGAPRHDGFVLMPNEIETYRLGPRAFEFKGTNGFMITFDINAKDVMAKD
jgi:hypothetical protein